LKPEVTADYDGVKVGDILKLTLKRLEEAKVTIGGVRVLSGDYLNDKNIMGQHYGVISAISRGGVDVLTEGAKKQLQEVFAKELKDGAEVLGAHQLLAKRKDLNAYSLRVLNDNLGTKRLGPGTYGMKLSVMGQVFIVLNPFHPYQLVPYTTPGHAIIVMEGRSTTGWKDLRNKVCGVTDPGAAEAGSIRRLLLEKKDALGMAEVSKSCNGCHMSAGPLEAMVELKRFFEVGNDKTSFGSLLSDKGLTEDRINSLAGNPEIMIGGKTQSSFDGTEEIDAALAARALLAASS